MKKTARFFAIFIILFLVLVVPANAGQEKQLIIINKSTNKLAFFEDGVLRRTFSVATGRKMSYTPEGKFKIVNKIKNRPYYKLGIPGGSPRNPLGDRWLGLNAGGTWGTMYGIHGNNNPSSIGTYASKGCVRMYDNEVRWLYDRVKLNTMVYITRSYKSFPQIAQSLGFVLPKSVALKSSQIKVTNNKEKADIVIIKGIKKGDVVKVYKVSQKGKAIGVQKAKGAEASLTIKQLGKQTGKIYLSVIRLNKTESVRVAVNFAGEQTDKLKLEQVKVVNNKAEADRITISNVTKGDTIKVYRDSKKGKTIATKKATGSLVLLSLEQLGKEAGKIYISVTHMNQTESFILAINFTGEQSDPLKDSQVKIINNKAKPDLIIISELTKGDLIRVYNSADNKLLADSGPLSDKTITLSIEQLGTTEGSIYVTITKPKMLESSKLSIAYPAEETTPPPTEKID